MSSQERRYLSSQESIGLAIFTSLQTATGTTANLLVIIYFLLPRNYKNRCTSDKLTLSLAISDLVALTTYLPWRTHLLLLGKGTEDYKIYTSLYVVCIFATGNAVISIAFDRFTAVIWSRRYKVLMTKRVSSTFIAVSWMSAVLLGVLHRLSYMFDKHKDYELFLCVISFVQLVVLTVIYSVLLIQLRKHTRNISKLRGKFQKEKIFLRKSVFTSFIIVCLFYIRFLPYIIYRVYSNMNSDLTDYEKHTAWRWLTASFVNSCCNPFVYFFGLERHMRRFRKCFMVMFNCRSNDETTNIQMNEIENPNRQAAESQNIT